MTTELTYLAAVLVLALVQVFLPAFGRTKQYGTAWNAGPRDEAQAPVSPLTGRLERAQANLYETLPLFIGVVLIAHVAGRNGELTAWGTAIYFWARVAYVPLYALGIPYVRSIAWLVSLGGMAAVFTAFFV